MDNFLDGLIPDNVSDSYREGLLSALNGSLRLDRLDRKNQGRCGPKKHWVENRKLKKGGFCRKSKGAKLGTPEGEEKKGRGVSGGVIAAGVVGAIGIGGAAAFLLSAQGGRKEVDRAERASQEEAQAKGRKEADSTRDKIAQQLKEREREVSQVRSENEQLRTRIEEVEKARPQEVEAAAQAARREAEDLVRQSQEQAAKLQEEVKRLDQERSGLEKQFQEQGRRVEELDKSIGDRDQELERLRQSAASQEAEIQGLKQGLQESQQQAAAAQQRVQQGQKAGADQARAIRERDATILGLERDRDAVVQERDRLRVGLEDTQRQLQATTQTLKDTQSSLERQNQVTTELGRVQNALTGKVKERGRRIAGQAETIGRQAQEIETLNQGMATAQKNLSAAEKRIAQHEQKDKAARKQIQGLTRDRDASAQEVSRLQGEADRLQRDIDGLSEERRSVEEDLKKTQAALENETGNRKAKEAEFQAASDRLKELSEESATRGQELSWAQRDLKESEARRTAAEASLKEAEARAAEVAASLGKERASHRSAQAEVQTLRQELERVQTQRRTELEAAESSAQDKVKAAIEAADKASDLRVQQVEASHARVIEGYQREIEEIRSGVDSRIQIALAEQSRQHAMELSDLRTKAAATISDYQKRLAQSQEETVAAIDRPATRNSQGQSKKGRALLSNPDGSVSLVASIRRAGEQNIEPVNLKTLSPSSGKLDTLSRSAGEKIRENGQQLTAEILGSRMQSSESMSESEIASTIEYATNQGIVLGKGDVQSLQARSQGYRQRMDELVQRVEAETRAAGRNSGQLSTAVSRFWDDVRVCTHQQTRREEAFQEAASQIRMGAGRRNQEVMGRFIQEVGSLSPAERTHKNPTVIEAAERADRGFKANQERMREELEMAFGAILLSPEYDLRGPFDPEDGTLNSYAYQSILANNEVPSQESRQEQKKRGRSIGGGRNRGMLPGGE